MPDSTNRNINVFVATLPSEYPTYAHCQRRITGILPIDYFLAKSLISDCVFNKPLNVLATQDDLFIQGDSSTQGHSTSQHQVTSASAVIFHAILQLSMSLREGHTCLPITELADKTFGRDLSQPTEHNTTQEIGKSGYTFPHLSAIAAIFSATNFADNDQHPIVYHNNSLYLRRYYLFEQKLQTQLNERTQGFTAPYKQSDITKVIAELFPHTADTATNTDEIDWQKVAVANSLKQGFSVIAGGPGTGKTYTVTKLLAALVMLNEQEASIDDLSIALVAPTGKAAQRLSESLVNAISGFKSLVCESVLAKIPTQAQTIHRLLGVIPNKPHFRHNDKNLLSCDVLLIDEVSMVDLPLMQRLLSALPSTTQVVLLGDADQLPSVEVGSVLSDIAPRPYPGFSKANNAYLTEVTGYKDLPVANGSPHNNNDADHCVFLTKSRRFDGKGGIGLLAQAVIAGNADASWQLLHNETHSETLSYISSSANTKTEGKAQIDQLAHILPLVKQYYCPLFSAQNISDCFNAFAQFRFLCATRKGTFGVENINTEVENYLVNANMIPSGKALYHAKPIMISANHYGLGLYNGDIGIAWLTEAGHLQVAFEKENGEYMWVLPSKLPEYESVYAMTIHKTQGSEFSHVSMLLPDKLENKLLSRELLYTGITRAKKRLSITCNQAVWNKGVNAEVKRFSNLNLF